MASATKKPSGLAISRKGMKFTFSWKIADSDYGAGQELQWRTNLTKWTSLSVGTSATSKTVTLSANTYWPYTKKYLDYVAFRVRGKRRTARSVTYNWSAWTENSWNMIAPETPSLTAALDSTLSNVTKFTWETPNVSDTNQKPFTRVEWQSLLVENSTVTDGSKLTWDSSQTGWQTGTGSASGSKEITESSLVLTQNSYTRWFRVRAVGCGGGGGIKGCSYWRYAKHVYALPYLPTISLAEKQGSTMWVYTEWTAGQNAAHPIDKTTVEWAIDTPLANLACPGNASWTEAAVSRDTSGSDAAKFYIDRSIGDDECLWVRVTVQHDRNQQTTDAKLVSVGSLSEPENLSVSQNDTTYRATITATNTSDVPDSALAVIFRGSENSSQDFIVGVIPHGETSVTVQCPDWSSETAIAFGVYAFQGTYSAKTRADNVTVYAVNANMRSAEIWNGGAVPQAPTNVTAVISGDTEGEVILTWNWSWSAANRAEISWSQNPNAWESTDEPSSYVLDNLHAAKWRVSGLETGTTWYFRIRLLQANEDETTYGPYSDAVFVDLSSAPSVPVLVLSSAVITKEETVTASWAYSTTDGTSQSYAEICEATVENNALVYGDIIAHATTAQHVTISADNWEVGTTHLLCVRVASASGHVSDGWSDPVAITVAEPVECEITVTSLITATIEDSDGDEREVLSLDELPLTATITGAGTSGTTTLIVERAAEYHMDRPDGSVSDGFEGETIVLYRQTGESQISIELEDLIGLFDDSAAYRLIATVEDSLGQSASASIDFEVHWAHQAEVPTVTVTMEDGVAVITATAPAGAEQGDVCDIYRLSADKPELIVEGGAFGTAYVDPYPAIGNGYGHRIVDRTVNGDYITADNQPAWVDTSDNTADQLDEYSIIVDFDGQQLILPYDITLSNRWGKDFKLTTYLGGSQQGDWNPSVTRTANYTVNLIADEDAETISGLRALAAFSGICHIRTPEGSSYSADIQVAESKGYNNWETVGYTLTVTRVDPEQLDGIPYSEWVTE